MVDSQHEVAQDEILVVIPCLNGLVAVSHVVAQERAGIERSGFFIPLITMRSARA